MNLPTKLTVLRILMIPVFVALYLIQFPYHDVIATAIFILASITDFLDGYIARKYDMVTDLGKFLDPVADKVLVMSALVLLCASFTGYIQTALVVCTIIILAREFIITGFRTIAVQKKVVLPADKLGKSKTVMQIIAIIALLLNNFAFSFYPAPAQGSYAQFPFVGVVVLMIGLIALLFATLLTIASAINYIAKNTSVLKEEPKKVTISDKSDKEEQ
jgi:CDP-diacylglycerol--glycerol-3-phosphate 3-phosphatidyltransferase